MIREETNNNTENSNLKIYKNVDNFIGKVIENLSRKKFLSDDAYNFHIPDRQVRPSLIRQDNNRKCGLASHRVIDPYSSDEDHVIEDEEEVGAKEPSVKLVCEHIFDVKTLMEIDPTLESFAEDVRHGLLLKNIDDGMSAMEVRTFLEDIPIFKINNEVILVDEIKVFNGGENYAFVAFTSNEQCKKACEYFNNPDKLEYNPTLNSVGEVITISYCFDLTDMKNSKWYAVVLRNLGSLNFIEFHHDVFANARGISYVLPPKLIYDSICSIVVMDDLDNAEKLCALISEKKIVDNFDGKTLKAHIHPRSDKKRLNPDLSHFTAFFKSSAKSKKSKKIKKDNTVNVSMSARSVHSSKGSILNATTGESKILSNLNLENNNRDFMSNIKDKSVYSEKEAEVSIYSFKVEKKVQEEININTNPDHKQENINNSVLSEKESDISQKIKLENMKAKLMSMSNGSVNSNLLDSNSSKKVTTFAKEKASAKSNVKNNNNGIIDPDLEKIRKLKELINTSSSVKNGNQKLINTKRERPAASDLETCKNLADSVNKSKNKNILNAINFKTIPLIASDNPSESKTKYYSSFQKINKK